MLSVKKVLAGRGAVDYYLNQTRHGLADYYLPERPLDEARDREDGPALSAPGSSWWGGGATGLGLSGEVQRAQFVPLYAKGVRPGGGYLGRRFRLPEDAAAARAAAFQAAGRLDDPYERWMARHEVRRRGGHASVAAWDCTFSPVKSVSLLWAAGDSDVQQQVWAAHVAAVDAGLAYLQEHAAYVRAGRNGVRVHDTTGLVVARMNEWTSRDGDMQLHTHCLVLNRAQTLDDGKWRALDGRALLAARTGAGAIYNRVLEAELTRRLGVAWRERPDGLRELVGVDDELTQLFSARRRAITAKLAKLTDAYRDKYGVPPPLAVLSAMAQDATLKTRAGKRAVSAKEALERWEAAARQRGRALDLLPRQVLGRVGQVPADRGDGNSDMQVAPLLERLAASARATFTRHDLLRAALDVIPPGCSTTEQLQTRAEHLVSYLIRRPDLLSLTAADVLEVPEKLRRRDGSSVYEQPQRQRWTLRSTLDQEGWLLDVAMEPCGPHLDPGTVHSVIADHELGDDQAQAVRELLGSNRRIGLLVGPAGAGKTRTLRAVVDAWRSTGAEVLGLTVSQAAAEVLAAEALVRTENTAKWLYETRRGRWQLPQGALVLVDEASMVSTPDMVDIVDQARQAGSKILLVGDTAQLAAIHIGGAFDLLVTRYGACQLHEIRRFTEPWERDASLRLRSRDPAALAEYAMRGRNHGGVLADIEDELFEAWRADALGTDNHGDRRSVLMIVATNEQAALMSERARNALIATGAVVDGPTTQLRDNFASVGDHIVTRRNDRRMRTSSRGWVVNGDVWTVIDVHDDGAASVRRHSDGASITLPADYLANHTHLAYATTAHRAQGITVDICHAAINADASHEQLYVAATRGREANHLWVLVGSDTDLVRDTDDLPTPEEILSRVLQRRDLERLSAHQVISDSQAEMLSLSRLGAIFEDAARTATDQWLSRVLASHGLAEARQDREWPSLVTRVRQTALAGHDVAALVNEAIRMRSTDAVRSTAAVLHWRLRLVAENTLPSWPRGPLASLPEIDGPAIEVARRAGELMRQHWRVIRESLAASTEAPPWGQPLGPRLTDVSDAAAWLTAATAVAAYRERYEVPHHTLMLGPRPSDSRPDAQAAFDHARLQFDRYLARRYRELDVQQLSELDLAQQAVLNSPPPFDPDALQQARVHNDQTARAWRTATGSARQMAAAACRHAAAATEAHERQARRHATWRHAADQAAARLRQLRLAQQAHSRRAAAPMPARTR